MTVSRQRGCEGRDRAARITGRVVLLLMLGLATESHSAVPRPRGLLAELEREIGGIRWIEPMLTISHAYSECSARADSAGPIPRTTCPAPALSRRTRQRITGIATRATAAAQGAADPDALHAVALIDLLFSEGRGNALNRSISYLQKAVRLSEAPARPLADLAAALLVRAEHTQNAQDLFEAVEMAAKALRHAPPSPAAQHNLALGLERVGARDEAAAAWRRFRDMERKREWRQEAHRRRQALRRIPARPAPPALHAPAAVFVRYAALAPQDAREWGWSTLMARWGTAHLHGNRASADAHLRAAELVGDALERQGGDATLAEAVRSVRACPAEQLAVLARAHRVWADARTLFDKDHVAPKERLAEVIRMRAPSPALDLWTRQYYAATLVATASLDSASSVLQQLLNETGNARTASVHGGALVVQGTAALRSGRYEHARMAYRRSAAAFLGAGETENWGRALSLLADADFSLGANREAYASVHRALTVLQRFPHSTALHSLLSIAGEELAGDGLLNAGLHLHNEDVAITSHGHQPLYQAEALIFRSQLRRLAGDVAGAAADVSRARSLADSLPPGHSRDWAQADIAAARAATVVRSDPARAVALLGSVIALPDGTLTAMRLLDALVARAEARSALADVAGATADLEQATTLLRRQHDEISSEPLRASLLDAARSVFDRIVMLHVEADRPDDALRVLERGRASLAAAGARPSFTDTALAAPRGQTVLDYALIGDTLLVWRLRGSSIRLVRSTVHRTELLRRIERAHTLLESGAPDQALLPVLSTLHDQLIGPVAADLGPRDSTLVLIADGELGGVPFAALYDRGTRRYLVQDYVPRHAANLQEAFPLPGRRPVPGNVALLAAGPATVRELPELQPLVQNQDEVRAISALYARDAEVLAGADATAPALARAIRRASLFHFAGHALVDDARPEQSSLLLAPASGAPSGRLTAEALGAEDLRHVRLVVLSACETLRSRDGRSGGLAGFSGALIAAGVQGVVGSTWRVDDRLTRELMIPFHRFYRASGDGPGALRQAQLYLLRSPNPTLRSPPAWAGFRYAGN